jgi:hypothetical protein
VVVISGVSRPMSPIPMGSTITSCLPWGSSRGEAQAG